MMFNNKNRSKSTIILLAVLLVLTLHHARAGVKLIQTFAEQNITGVSSFGHSVSGTGDVNGDTFDDVADPLLAAGGYHCVAERTLPARIETMNGLQETRYGTNIRAYTR